LHTVKNDYDEIQKNNFNSRFQDPRNHTSQLQIDRKTQAMGLARGLSAKSFKIVHFK
jgi:hypothetical protein